MLRLARLGGKQPGRQRELGRVLFVEAIDLDVAAHVAGYGRLGQVQKAGDALHGVAPFMVKAGSVHLVDYLFDLCMHVALENAEVDCLLEADDQVRGARPLLETGLLDLVLHLDQQDLVLVGGHLLVFDFD